MAKAKIPTTMTSETTICAIRIARLRAALSTSPIPRSKPTPNSPGKRRAGRAGSGGVARNGDHCVSRRDCVVPVDVEGEEAVRVGAHRMRGHVDRLSVHDALGRQHQVEVPRLAVAEAGE